MKTVQIRCLSTVRSNMMDYLITWCGIQLLFFLQINFYCEQNLFQKLRGTFWKKNCKDNNKHMKNYLCTMSSTEKAGIFGLFFSSLKYTMRNITKYILKFSSWSSLAKSKRNAGQFNYVVIAFCTIEKKNFFQFFLKYKNKYIK